MVSDFNDFITGNMLTVAKDQAEIINVSVIEISHVPGAFDIPIIVNKLLARSDIDAVVTLGAIIKGETKHDEIIANSTASTLSTLSVTYGKPVSLGIIGPGMTSDQAKKRAEPVAKRAVNAARILYNEIQRVEN